MSTGDRAEMKSLQEATRRWNAEVETEAIRLIERGTPPYDALEQAKSIVNLRRRNAIRERRHD